jgi:alpha-galactosidase
VKNRFGEWGKLPIRLKGLDATKRYKIRETNLYPGTQSPINSEQIYSGDFLMKVGFNPDVNSGRKSVVLVIEEVR